MAGNATLGDAIQRLMDNAENAAAFASVALRNQIKKDFEKAARDAVDKYYEYQNGAYTKHGRQYRLYDVYTVAADSKKKGKGYTIDAAITMDSDILYGWYNSNSAKHNGTEPWKAGGDVEADYVFKNFLKGVHPWTNGYPLNGVETLQYELREGPGPNPTEMLDQYLENYGERYLNKHFRDILSGLLKLYS